MKDIEKLQLAMMSKEAGFLGALGRGGAHVLNWAGRALGGAAKPFLRAGASNINTAGKMGDTLSRWGSGMLSGANKMQGKALNLFDDPAAAQRLGKHIAGYGGTALGVGGLAGISGYGSGQTTGRKQGIGAGLQLAQNYLQNVYGGIGGRLKGLIGGAAPGQERLSQMQKLISSLPADRIQF